MGITLEKAYAEFLSDSRLLLRQTTLRGYKTFCNYFFSTVEADMSKSIREEITQKKYNEYLSYLRERTENDEISTATVNTYLRPVRRFISYCSDRGYIKIFKTHLIKQVSPPKPTLTDDELERILDNVRTDNQSSIICLLLAVTGGRSRSIRSLRVHDIDFLEYSITFTATKNGKILKLPIDKTVAAIVCEFCRLNNRMRDDYIFQNNAGKVLDKYAIYKRVNTYMKGLGINKTGVHLFRWSVAKQFVLRGMDAITLQHWLGHSSVVQSAHYVAIFGDELRRNFDKYNIYSITKNNLHQTERF